MSKRWLLVFQLFLFLQMDFIFAQQKIWVQQAQAAEDEVVIYSGADFDSEILTTIKPGKYYWITAKPEGPFYKILIGPKQVGYVPDTELNIKGKGVFQPKSFEADGDAESQPEKKNSRQRQKPPEVNENQDEDQSVGKNHLLSFNLVNYHEDTLGGVQVGDLWAINYKNLAWGADQADYGMGGLSWDIMAAFSAPDYYRKKTGFPASGAIIWGGIQFQNYTLASSYSQLRYGLGPFVKYSHFDVQSSLKKYSLQDVTIGVTLEAGFQILWSSVGLDLGLRYYWDKTPYGVLSLGFLF